MSRLLRAMVLLVLVWVSWVGFAFYTASQRTPDMIYVREPDAGPGIFPMQAKDHAAPHMLVSPCPLTPQNVPIVPPERNA
jgi:hypothetical protein